MLRPIPSVRLLVVATVLFAAGSLLAGCAKKSQETTSASSATSAESTATPPAPALNDANIAAIVVAANTVDIQNAQQAERITKNAKVKAFARRMITDHTAVNKQAADLAKKLNLTPEDNDTSRGLVTGADSTRAQIKAKTGADFDKAYVDNEVSYHQAVLDMLDKTLIPGAQNAELKKLLEDTRPAIAGHLKMAQDLQAALSSTSAK